MIIISGELRIAAADRERYLAASTEVCVLARRTPGCLDFILAADPVEPDRIHVFERWDGDANLERFRATVGPEPDLPPMLSAEVHKYRIAAVEPP